MAAGTTSLERMKRRLTATVLLALGAGTLGSCFNSDQGPSAFEIDPYSTSSLMEIGEVSNGFGRLLPYVVHRVVNGIPSPSQLVEIRTMDDLLANPPSADNKVLSPATWNAGAQLPTGSPGNHFVSVRFTRSIDLTSILDPTAGGLANNGLTGAVTVVAYDPVTGFSEAVPGRGFINGLTYSGNPPVLEAWVAPNGGNRVADLPVERGGVAVNPNPGKGFPGTDDPENDVFDGSFTGAGLLINPATFVYVVDSDNDLTTHETFPANRVIRVIIGEGVRDTRGRALEEPGVATSVVGNDARDPFQLLDGVAGRAVTAPPDLSSGVPCDVGRVGELRWSFSEAVQPYSVGPLPGAVPPSLSQEFTVAFQPPVALGQPPPGQLVRLPYTVVPVSPFNFTEYEIVPVVNFPGSDPLGASTQVFITFFHNAPIDLFDNQDENSTDSTRITFTTEDCPGLVNAPVAPGAIYVASNGGGTSGGIRVIDLDGFGQGTGDPTYDDNGLYNVVLDDNGVPIAGDITKFPFNPNLQEPDLFPPLTIDTTTLAGGSRGVFQLAQDSTLRTQLADDAVVGIVGDMMLGHPLDRLFNNFQCLSGGQNACAHPAFQFAPILQGGDTNAGAIEGNNITSAPHPNPPRLKLSPSCFAPLIMTEEPSFGDANRDGIQATNRLQPGDAFGQNGGLPPSGLLTDSTTYSSLFWGPAPTSTSCPVFTLRQQVGHILYVLDIQNNRVVALNSNRMTVIDEIPVSDPEDLAISPDLNLLAVSNRGTNTVTFIDTDPRSPNFHQITKITTLFDMVNNRIGLGPTELVWQPDDEDILVICQRSNSMAIISTGSLEVRKIIPGVTQPKLVAVSGRDAILSGPGFGFSTGLYYAYVISQDGNMTIFESGPDGVNGIGFDDFIGIPSLPGRNGFNGASAIQPDPNSFYHGMYVAFRDNNNGAVANLHLQNSPTGPRNLSQNAFLPDPNFRSKEWRVARLFSGVFSSSSILDVAVDDLTNVGAFPFFTSAFSSNRRAILHSAKGLVRQTGVPNGAFIPTSAPQFLFAANANGRIDVIEISTGQPYVQPIRTAGDVLCSYWRQ